MLKFLWEAVNWIVLVDALLAAIIGVGVVLWMAGVI